MPFPLLSGAKRKEVVRMLKDNEVDSIDFHHYKQSLERTGVDDIVRMYRLTITFKNPPRTCQAILTSEQADCLIHKLLRVC